MRAKITKHLLDRLQPPASGKVKVWETERLPYAAPPPLGMVGHAGLQDLRFRPGADCEKQMLGFL
jgi:hypothetical protein